MGLIKKLPLTKPIKHTKMKIKQLQQSQEIYLQLVKLDEEIISIDKRITKLLDKTQSVKMELEFEKTKKKKSILDEDGSINLGGDSMNKYFIQMMNPYAINSAQEDKGDVDKFTLNETESIYILSVLVNLKKDKRKLLMNQLREFGFEL